MDDRILVVPPIWAPDPAVFAKWSAFRALLLGLRTFLPVDFLLWPTLKGQEVVGSGLEAAFNALRVQIRPEHHVLQVVAAPGELLFETLAERSARSLVTAGFLPLPKTLAALTGTKATWLQAAYRVGASDSQLFHLVMPGADEADIQRVIDEVNRTRDRMVMLALFADLLAREPPPVRTLNIPALFLWSAEPLPDIEERLEVFRHYIPTARQDQSKEFGHGLDLKNQAGGHELANKVIPFIQEVIAARNAG